MPLIGVAAFTGAHKNRNSILGGELKQAKETRKLNGSHRFPGRSISDSNGTPASTAPFLYLIGPLQKRFQRFPHNHFSSPRVEVSKNTFKPLRQRC
jgi:hypothetical protein